MGDPVAVVSAAVAVAVSVEASASAGAAAAVLLFLEFPSLMSKKLNRCGIWSATAS